MNPLAIDLRVAREAKGWTQQQLADEAGVRQATISDIETGRGRRVDLDVMDRIAGALGVSALSLFVERDPPKKKRGR